MRGLAGRCGEEGSSGAQIWTADGMVILSPTADARYARGNCRVRDRLVRWQYEASSLCFIAQLIFELEAVPIVIACLLEGASAI